MLELVREAWSRRKWLGIVLFVLPFTAATSFIAFMPNMYQSTASVLVERQQVPEALVRPTVTSELETRLRTISQEALSRSRLDALITRFGLYADMRKSSPQEAVIERMRSDIRLDLRGTDTRARSTTIAFALSYRGPDPETVAQVTNSLASFFIEENLKARERQATGTAQFLKVQLQETRKRLDEQEKQVSDFKKRHVGELPQQMPANLAALEQLNAQLRLNSVSRMRLDEKRELLLGMQVPDATPAAAGTAAAPMAPTPSPREQASQVRLAQLKQQLDELAIRFTPNHPSVVMKQAEIAALEERLGREPKAALPAAAEGKAAEPRPSPASTPQAARVRLALAEVEAEIKILKDEDVRLRAALASYETRVSNIPKREQEFQELSRDYDSTRELYQSLTKRYDEAQIAESMEQRQKGEQFRILDPALASALPAAPNRPRLMVMALVLSLGLGVGAVVLAEGLDSSFHSLDRLRAFTSVPVLVSIPRITTAADKRRRRWRFRLAAAGTTAGLGLIVGLVWLFAHGNEALVRW